MTITITAEKIPLSVLNNALEYFDSIIDMGFNGKYLRNTDDINGETTYYALSLTLHVDYMLSEIQSMRKILRDYTSGFECTENSVKHSKKDSVVPKTKLQKQLVQDPSNPEVANAVIELFKQVSGNTTEEIAANVVLTLFSHNFKRQATYDTYKKFIVAYAKAEKKPKSYRSLCDVVGKNIPATTQKKANALISQKLGVETTFMEFLKHMPNFATEDNKESSPEEVVLERPKKPPKRKYGSSYSSRKETEEEIYAKKWQTINYAIENIPVNSTISEKAKLILECMGVYRLELRNRTFLQKLFSSILFLREANLEKLFECDHSLKRYGSLDNAEYILEKFLENFFKKSIYNTDIEEFLKELISKFPRVDSQRNLSNTNLILISDSKSSKLKQEYGILKCFPKNDEFDRFLRSVFTSKISRKNKVLTILNYMGLKQLSSNEIEVIKKLCIKHLYMFNFYNPEQNYTEEEKLILERFVNDFAKSLKEDANFISLKNFVKELSKIP